MMGKKAIQEFWGSPIGVKLGTCIREFDHTLRSELLGCKTTQDFQRLQTKAMALEMLENIIDSLGDDDSV
jgi:hypothetical protein